MSTPVPSPPPPVPAAPGTGAAPNPPAMRDPTTLLVRAFKGFLYSPLTKQLYYTNNRESVGPSTYERPWSVNPNYGYEHPIYPLNPVDYCTADTADAVLSWAKDNWPSLVFDIIVPIPEGFVTQAQYWLLVTNHEQSIIEVYGAGLWAFDHDKDGDASATEQRTAELRQAGFSV